MSSSTLHHTEVFAHKAVHQGITYAVEKKRDDYFKANLPKNGPATRRQGMVPEYGAEQGSDAHPGASAGDRGTSWSLEGKGWVGMLVILFMLWYRYHVEGYKVVTVLPVLLFWHRLGKSWTPLLSLVIWYWCGLVWWKILIVQFFRWH